MLVFQETLKNVYDKAGVYSTELFTQRAEELIANYASDEPMFIYLAYQAVHCPLQAPKEFIDKFSHIKHKGRRIYAAMTAYLDYGVGRVRLAILLWISFPSIEIV